MARVLDIVVLSIASFLGNVGVALTGFGMAIIYLFIYQIVVLAGYEGDFRNAVFIQALALFSAQPLLLKKSEFRKYASWNVLRYFIPITIISTPFGQFLGNVVSTDMVEMIAGCLVTFVATFEMYQKRKLFAKHIRKTFCKGKKSNDVENPAPSPTNTRDSAGISRKTSQGSSITDEEEETSSCFNDAYELGKTLGTGAFSVVKEGRMKMLESRTFAIKIIEKTSILEDEEARLVEEIALLQEIKHDNILCVRKVYNEPKAYYLVSDIMYGGDLLTRLNRYGFFLDSEACRIAKSVLDAVRYIHDSKIAHRDLKPENILFASNDNNSQIKLADFGFAKREKTTNSFSTMCGTPAYVAPEIINGVPYGCEVDLWSFGVIVWVMLVGYQPFRGNTDQDVQSAIKSCEFVFDEEYWRDINLEAKHFISSLLVVDPVMRMSAKGAQSHPWILNGDERCDHRVHQTKVFFMIGSQRSGSNWLRTMLDDREDLAGPHPPHMMRDILPIIDKFGDLSIDENFRVLVDHVCIFVERNQVPWTDKHGSSIKFLRPVIYAYALKSCTRIQNARSDGKLCSRVYLLSVFDAIMTYYTKVNGKHTWICKSMGMSQHHDLLLEFYGSKRLRYIYLVRDPRDVAMSFMKTPVGDCHWHAIATKWTKLQQFGLRILNDCPELVYKLHYEHILQDKEKEIKALYDFIGERRFGGVKRQASVLCMDNTENLINRAKDGSEAQKALRLSYQFKNLGRGMSFAKRQNKKWLHPETGLKTEEIQIIETLAHGVMLKLEYEPHLVGSQTEPSVWSAKDLERFRKLNEEGILKMKEDLAKENPEDLGRRVYQAEALKMTPVYKAPIWEDNTNERSSEIDIQDMWERIRNYLNMSRSDNGNELDAIIHDSLSVSIRTTLNSDGLNARREVSDENLCFTKSGVRVRWASGTQSGYDPDLPNKPNQDRFVVQLGMTQKSYVDWFGVYDGNGSNGHHCSEFARQQLPKEFEKRVASGESVLSAVGNAYKDVHKRLIERSDTETEISGTTATTLLLTNDKCVIAYVGDSPAILGWQDDSESLSAKYLNSEHTPKRVDERERIKRAGGAVMTTDQRDGVAPIHENWREDEAPRVWSKDSMKFPGCAFTRSIGNGIAHTLGVTARPDFTEHEIDGKERVLIVASDGITEFMDAQTCVEIACSYTDPAEAANSLIHEASERWLSRGDYMDDITVIVLFFDKSDHSGSCYQNYQPELGMGSSHATRDIDVAIAEAEEQQYKKKSIGIAARIWTLLAGYTSGFLGGLCGIRGPPVILYFLHPPKPIKFDKNSQRATGSVITATNVAMRVVYYFIETFALGKDAYFKSSDWNLYACIIISSLTGVLVGSKLFDMMKDSRNNIRMILSIFLLLCGVSLLISSFHVRF